MKADYSISDKRNAALGPLMNDNHQVLQQMDVSSPELDTLVEAAREAGALGAKLSGGGRGGNMIALVEPTNRREGRRRPAGSRRGQYDHHHCAVRPS